MAAGHPYYTLGGSDTVQVSVAVAKGQGLEADPDNAGKCRPWSAGSTTRVGVAMIPGGPLETNAADDFDPHRRHVSVARAPQNMRMRFTGATSWRQAVVAAADGAVAPAGATPAVGTIVGYCDEPGGVASAGEGRVELI